MFLAVIPVCPTALYIYTRVIYITFRPTKSNSQLKTCPLENNPHRQCWINIFCFSWRECLLFYHCICSKIQWSCNIWILGWCYLYTEKSEYISYSLQRQNVLTQKWILSCTKATCPSRPQNKSYLNFGFFLLFVKHLSFWEELHSKSWIIC